LHNYSAYFVSIFSKQEQDSSLTAAANVGLRKFVRQAAPYRSILALPQNLASDA
jgi:hypothetical protein